LHDARYIEHWNVKVSSLLGSEPSKTSGTRVLTEEDGFGLSGIAAILLAKSSRDRAKVLSGGGADTPQLGA